jgi:general stress protein YciG
MDPSKQKEIASKGGRAAHAKGTAHEFTTDEARVAGRKGGETVSRDRAHMAAIGREGGHSRGARARAGSPGAGNDVAQPTGSQQFVRQASEDHGGYDGNRSDRQSGSRDDRGDSSSEGGPMANRDQI